MRKFNMFVTAICVLFLVKLRWPKNKSLYESELIQNHKYILHAVNWLPCGKTFFGEFNFSDRRYFLLFLRELILGL